MWPWQIYQLSVGPVEPHRWAIDRPLIMSTMTIHTASSISLPSKEEVVEPFSGQKCARRDPRAASGGRGCGRRRQEEGGREGGGRKGEGER